MCENNLIKHVVSPPQGARAPLFGPVLFSRPLVSARSGSHLFRSLVLILRLLLILTLPMLATRHLQKVLFTADEAHGASHPSEPSARTASPPALTGCHFIHATETCRRPVIAVTSGERYKGRLESFFFSTSCDELPPPSSSATG